MKGTRDFLRFAPESINQLLAEYFSRNCKYLSVMRNHFFPLQSFKELVAACLVKDPKKRPSSEKLWKHHFFKHARSHEYLARTILDGLSPLGDRFRMLKVSIHHQLPFANYKLVCMIYVFILFHQLYFRKKRLISLFRTRIYMGTKNICHR